MLKAASALQGVVGAQVPAALTAAFGDKFFRHCDTQVKENLRGNEREDLLRRKGEQEMADVLLYLVRLADQCSVDLPTAARRKLEKNKQKYPPELCKGSAAKYTEYQTKNE